MGCSPGQARVNTASNAWVDGLKSSRLQKAALSVAPCTRSMRLSSHSTDSGPWVAGGVVERDDDGFEVDQAAPHAAKIPIAPRIAKAGVAAKHAHRAVALAPPDIFHVHVVDAP